jgi:hypothetical protein
LTQEALSLSIVALILAVVALVLGATRRAPTPLAPPEPDHAWEPAIADLRRDVEDLRLKAAEPRTDPEVAALREQLDEALRELTELRVAAVAPPPPPLPKARSGGLDDLREQLKAAQQSASDEDDDELP